MKKFFATVDKVNKALWYLSSLMLVLIVFSTFYEVICRYVFNHSNVWVGEYSGYLFAFIAFLAAPYAYSQGGMTTVDALIQKMKPRIRFVVKLFSIGMSFVFLSVLFYKSTELMQISLTKGWKSNSALATPLWIPQLAVPAGSLLLCFTSIVLFLKTIYEYQEEKKEKTKEGKK